MPKPEPTSPAVGSLAPNSCGQSTVRSSRDKDIVLLARELKAHPVLSSLHNKLPFTTAAATWLLMPAYLCVVATVPRAKAWQQL